jgi:Tol biopolymer transport system component
LVNSTLFAVSHSELAISVGCEDRYIGNCVGTLGEVPLAGGSPRETVPNAAAADWSYDYKEMAVVRSAAGKYAVEFPRGKAIYEGGHSLGNLRISPDGKALAFTEFFSLDGDGGWVVVLDRNGKELVRSKNFTSIEGLAWSPSGKEVWVAATRTSGWSDSIFGLALNGAERIVLRLPGMLRLHDVAPDGRVLLTHENWRSELQYRGAKDSQERNLSWLDYANLSDLSDDGSLIAFDDWGEASGLSDLAYVRKADGSPATKLGQFYAPVLSPDGRYVLTNDASQAGAVLGFLLVPTGTGDIQRIGSEGIGSSPTIGFLPGGKTIYRMNFDGQVWRIFLQDVPSGTPHAMSPAVFPTAGGHFESHVASPDGKWIFAHDLSGQGTLYPIDGGSPHPIPGCHADDIWIRWSADAKSGYVYHDEKKSAPVFRIDVTSGKRDRVWTLMPGDPAGVTSIYRVRLSADGKTYAYSYVRELSDLFQVEGVR